MPIPSSAIGLRFDSFGDPAKVLRVVDVPVPNLEPGHALLKVLAASINPADFGRILGSYGDLPELPATGGLEGVAEIVALEGSAGSRRVGERVFVPSSVGSWQTYAVARADQLFPAPHDLAIEQAAMGWVNPPTAWKLLHDFQQVDDGDWIVQNAATSAVGKLVIQFAALRGIRSVNLVRNPNGENAASLSALGADIIVADDRDAADAALEATGGTKPKLGLNSVGGRSALTMCRMLAERSPLVTFGGMDRVAAPFPTRYLIFHDLVLRGFWISRWYKEAPREEIEALHRHVFAAMKNADIETDIAAAFPLERWPDALEAAQAPGKPGKVVFRINPPGA